MLSRGRDVHSVQPSILQIVQGEFFSYSIPPLRKSVQWLSVHKLRVTKLIRYMREARRLRYLSLVSPCTRWFRDTWRYGFPLKLCSPHFCDFYGGIDIANRVGPYLWVFETERRQCLGNALSACEMAEGRVFFLEIHVVEGNGDIFE